LLQIYVSGAVTTAQVISVPKGSLVVDAVDAVGGAAPDADLDALNLAEPLNNYQHVLVPTRSTPAPESTPPPAAEVTTPDRVNINTASAAELETLPHIGPSRAQNILAYREAHGPFNAIEEIKNVKGIGDATFADLAPLITVSP
jgi:competence protein ComEA